MKEIKVFEAQQYGGNWPTESGGSYSVTLVEFIAWATDILEAIPDEYQKITRISIEGEDHYDQALAEMKITYERPETPEEIVLDRQADERAANHQKERELKKLAELKAKYEG